MTRLNRRLLRWRRYAHRTAWNPRITRPAWCGPDSAISFGHMRAWAAVQIERERRADLVARRYAWHDDRVQPAHAELAVSGECGCFVCEPLDEPDDEALDDEPLDGDFILWAGELRPVETIDTGGLL
ncbi:hypothetical protein L083_6009 [Actinoplanes sp. N902-109]|nr:hypothetical protein L083_6009 [Actinoplanes sp. N902-109]